MSRYDGLIIPRSYSEYINKTDAATLLQALQLSGVMDNAPTANSNHPTKSSGVYTALTGKQKQIKYGVFLNIDQNTTVNTTKSGTYTTTKDCLIRISNGGTASASSTIAWARILISGQVVASYTTTTYGSGQVIAVPAGVQISYDLHNNDAVQMQITYYEL